MKAQAENATQMVISILAKTKKLLLLGFSVPLDDTLVLGAWVDMLVSYLKSCYAQGVSFILYWLAIAVGCIALMVLFEQLILFSQLHKAIIT